jgi:MFS family permease
MGIDAILTSLAAGPAYINELAPKEIRGVIMTFWQMFYSVGAFLAYWVRYACSNNAKKLGEWDWRMVIMFQLLMPILIVGLVFTIPETPRWYIQKGDQVEKARKSLRRVRNTDEEVEIELQSIREAIQYEKGLKNSGYSALWYDKSVRRRLFIAFALNAGQQITGQGTLNTYSTIIYKKVFKPGQVDLINALNATLGIFFTLNAVWTVDRFGRKFLFIVGAIGMGICMLIVASVGVGTPFYTAGEGGILIPSDDKVNGTKTTAVAYGIAVMFFLFSFFCKHCMPPRINRMLTPLRQTLLGRNNLDLDRRSLLHERPRPSNWHGLADAKHCASHFRTILSYLPEQDRICMFLFLHGHQYRTGTLCVACCS